VARVAEDAALWAKLFRLAAAAALVTRKRRRFILFMQRRIGARLLLWQITASTWIATRR
jgi:hypothetical protein